MCAHAVLVINISFFDKVLHMFFCLWFLKKQNKCDLSSWGVGWGVSGSVGMCKHVGIDQHEPALYSCFPTGDTTVLYAICELYICTHLFLVLVWCSSSLPLSWTFVFGYEGDKYSFAHSMGKRINPNSIQIQNTLWSVAIITIKQIFFFFIHTSSATLTV